MRNMTKAVLLLALLLCVARPAAAEKAQQWYIDPPHCSITFTIDHLLAKVPGQFLKFFANVAFDPERPADSSIEFAVETSSVNTHVEARDKHLRTGDFFDAEKYPRISFKTDSIEKTGENTYALHGVLTMKDVSKKVTLPMEYLGEKGGVMRPTVNILGLHSSFVVDRLEYGVGSGKFYKMGLVGKEVEVQVHLELLDEEPS